MSDFVNNILGDAQESAQISAPLARHLQDEKSPVESALKKLRSGTSRLC
jgi:hypothetical protein